MTSLLRSTVFAFVATFVHAVGLCQTQALADIQATRKASEGIVASVAAGNYAGALKELRPLSVIPSTEFDVFEAQFNSQQVNLLRQFGSSTGYEYLRSDNLGTRLVRQQFLVFHEKGALRWTFIFYQAEKGWVMSHFIFDGNALTFFAGGA